jgi:hypothetical protein
VALQPPASCYKRTEAQQGLAWKASVSWLGLNGGTKPFSLATVERPRVDGRGPDDHKHGRQAARERAGASSRGKDSAHDL